MNQINVHHIGYFVKDINAAIDAFQSLGYLQQNTAITDETRGINICFLRNGPLLLELISPCSEFSPLYSLYKKYRNVAYHICYECEDLLSSIKVLEKAGFSLFQAPASALALGNRNVSFLLHPALGIIELLEK